MTLKIFLKHCMKKHNLLRALYIALLVGTILAAINHYDMFLSGEFVTRRIIQIVVTYFVPFFVALTSAAMFGRHEELKHHIRNGDY